MIGRSIGRYEIRKEIGRGGMATVYHAYDSRFRREVALKVLPAAFLHDPQFRTRFEREAQTIAGLEHPAIVPVYDYGEGDGWLYLVMRLMNGGTLAQRLEDGPMPVEEVARIFGRLAPALDTVHLRSIVHRDLKPTNILFDEWDNPYLSDFGIAKLVAGSRTALTASGGLIGTAEYMSPEQVQAKVALDGRSDIYSMGVILFEMLSGQVPFQADTPMGTAVMHLHDAVPDISEINMSLPSASREVIQRALAKNRDERYQSAIELARAVENLATVMGIETTRGIGSVGSGRPPVEEPIVIELSPVSGETKSAESRSDRPAFRPEVRDDSAHSPVYSRRQLEDSPSQRQPIQKKRPISGCVWVGGGVLAIFGSILALAVIVVLMTSLPGPPGEEEPTERPTTAIPNPSATNALRPTDTVAPNPTATNTQMPGDTPIPIQTPTLAGPVLEGILLDTLEGHANSVLSVAFSPDGTTLASGSSDATVRLWRVSDGLPLDTLEGHTLGVLSVAFSPDGITLASGSTDDTVRLWQVNNGTLLDTMEGHDLAVFSVAFSPNGTILASGSRDQTVRLWQVSDGTLLDTLQGHLDYVESVAFSPDGTTLASGSGDSTVRLWRVSDSTLLDTLRGHVSGVLSVAFSPDGTTLASGSWDQTVRLWRVSGGAPLETLQGGITVRSVAFSPDGTILAAGLVDGTVRLWQVSDGQLLATLEGHNSDVYSLVFSPNGTKLALGLRDGTIRIWGISVE